jgi:hypothetical protein
MQWANKLHELKRCAHHTDSAFVQRRNEKTRKDRRRTSPTTILPTQQSAKSKITPVEITLVILSFVEWQPDYLFTIQYAK